MSDSLQPHGLQHARLLCLPPLSPTVCSHSCPLSQWCYLTISFSSTLFFYFQSFSASRSFPMIWFFASGGQGITASASVLPMNIKDWFSLELSGLISLQSRGLSRIFSNTTNCPQSVTQMLFPQIFHQLPHFLPGPLHILFSHPYLWLSLPQSHVPSRQQDRLPNTEPPTISSRYTVFTAPKGRAGGSPLLASCPFSFFSHCPGWHFPCWDFWLLSSLWTPLLLGLSLLSHCRCSTMPLQLPDLLPLTSYS